MRARSSTDWSRHWDGVSPNSIAASVCANSESIDPSGANAGFQPSLDFGFHPLSSGPIRVR